jgi:hypothetical protein
METINNRYLRMASLFEHGLEEKTISLRCTK